MTAYNFSWKKHGRIFASTGQHPWMASHNQNPCALVLEDRIRVYFTCRPGPDSRGLFNSVTSFVEIDRTDHQKVLYVHDRPILSPGGLGAFDQFGIMPGAVLQVGNEVWLYYVGWMRCEGAPYTHAIGLAISRDGGVTFERYAPGPVIARTPMEPFLQNSPTVSIVDGKFHMWYSSGVRWLMHEGRPESVYVLMHAVSDDGIEWRREGVPCMPTLTPDECQTNPSMLQIGGLYHLWFCHRHGTNFRNKDGGYRIGYATSTDLLHWQRQDELSALEPSDSGWDSEMICYPNVVPFGEELRMFYSGNHFGRDGFGVATCVPQELR
jgi:sucrose-6-phosphate hydrolase SacC (GH32 family)